MVNTTSESYMITFSIITFIVSIFLKSFTYDEKTMFQPKKKKMSKRKRYVYLRIALAINFRRNMIIFKDDFNHIVKRKIKKQPVLFNFYYSVVQLKKTFIEDYKRAEVERMLPYKNNPIDLKKFYKERKKIENLRKQKEMLQEKRRAHQILMSRNQRRWRLRKKGIPLLRIKP